MPFLPPNQQRQSTEGNDTNGQIKYASQKLVILRSLWFSIYKFSQCRMHNSPESLKQAGDTAQPEKTAVYR